jgi:hypothetical protein
MLWRIAASWSKVPSDLVRVERFVKSMLMPESAVRGDADAMRARATVIMEALANMVERAGGNVDFRWTCEESRSEPDEEQRQRDCTLYSEASLLA